jgi:heme exporter protein D
MSAAAWVWFGVGMATLLFMAGIILALIRHVKALGATVARFREDVQPVLERLRSESLAAQARAEDLPERVPRRGPGARLRR